MGKGYYATLSFYLLALCANFATFKGLRDAGRYMRLHRDTLDSKLVQLNGLGGYFFTNWNFVSIYFLKSK